MTLALAILTTFLTYRDPELDGPRGGRFGVASFWLLLAATVAVIARDIDRWGATAVMAAASVGTAGRPLLLMNVGTFGQPTKSTCSGAPPSASGRSSSQSSSWPSGGFPPTREGWPISPFHLTVRVHDAGSRQRPEIPLPGRAAWRYLIGPAACGVGDAGLAPAASSPAVEGSGVASGSLLVRVWVVGGDRLAGRPAGEQGECVVRRCAGFGEVYMTMHQGLRTGAGGARGPGVAAATADRDDEPEAAQG